MSYRTNRPATPQRPNSERPDDEQDTTAELPAPRKRSSKEEPKKERNMGKWLKMGLIALAVAAVVFVGWWMFVRSGSVASTIDGGKYQAVFFTNGQVYFGKLHIVNGEYMALKDIFYLQAKSTTKDDKNPQQTSDNTASDVELIKLGSEIHGPDDEMIISKDQVLFFENLKEDSTVSKTIKQYQEQNK